MTESILFGLASIIVLGIAAQWLAWAISIPSIFLLLLIGIAAGPITGWLQPEELFGDLLFPIVSLSVAVILFEGALSLRTVVLRDIGKVLRNLITVGVLATWLITTAAAYILLDFDLSLAVLVGAMLVVSGPTVVGPILRHARPVARLHSVLQWEGILIDPLGVLLAVLVFEVILIRDVQMAATFVLKGMLIMVVVGSGLGFLGAKAAVSLIQRRLIPEDLHNAITLMIVILAFTIANWLHHEAGLFTVTVMGIVMANQKAIVVRHIIEFKETLRTLLIAGLFIVLAARLELSALEHLNGSSVAFLAVLILIARPVAVALSTLGSEMPWQERVFVAWLAPRGVVAAAMSSIFALRLREEGYAQADEIVPLTFMVIIGCVAVYGLTAAPLARWLKVAQQNPQGVLFIGASPLVQAVARALQDAGIPTCLVDTNRMNIATARMNGLRAYYGNALSDEVLGYLNLDGIGRVLAFTPNDEANALAAIHFAELFGRTEAYQLVPNTLSRETDTAQHLRGRFLFDDQANYNTLSARLAAGEVVKTTSLSEQFDYKAFQALYNGSALPLFVITTSGQLRPWALGECLTPEPGQRIISLAPADVLATVPPDTDAPRSHQGNDGGL